MLQASAGFTTLIMGPHAFEGIFLNGAIQVYSGADPVTANDPATGTLLGTVTNAGLPWAPGVPDNGLQFLRDGPYIVSAPTQNWVLTVAADGVAGYFRVVGNALDPGGASFTLPRLQGRIAVAPTAGEFRIGNINLLAGQQIAVGTFFYTIPPIVSF